MRPQFPVKAMIGKLIGLLKSNPSAPHPPNPPRPLKYGWALAITGAVVAELFLACRLPVNPYLANFLAGAGLQRICDQPPANP